ncbi:MAG: hypothetical protein HOP30_14735 [Cyclobacteriaceae bacterium]|nr:hypothetical protein [Cyclobacteriaceae bacterium]
MPIPQKSQTTDERRNGHVEPLPQDKQRLQIGKKYLVAGIPMELYYYQGNTPVFTHTQNQIQINYINHQYEQNQN